MWSYEKRLQYPVNIKKPNPKAAQIIISQYGGLYFIKVYTIQLVTFLIPEVFALGDFKFKSSYFPPPATSSALQLPTFISVHVPSPWSKIPHCWADVLFFL